LSAYLRWMTQAEAVDFSNDDVWALWAPLIEAVRPKGKTPPQDLRRTLSAIVWRHDNGTKWRSVPPHLGPWWRAAQLSIRWSKLGVWQRLLELCQERGLSLGLVHLDGTVIRAHHKAAGAEKRGSPGRSETTVKRWVALVVAMARRPA
jgi:transposase